MTMRSLLAASVALLSLPSLLHAVAPTAEEMADSQRWAATKFEGLTETSSAAGQFADGRAPCFSFNYGGKPSSELLKTWKLSQAKQSLDAQRMQYTLTYTDSTTGLVVRCVAVEYRAFPAVEWTLYFKNTGDKNTPILADIQALDCRFQRANQGEFMLHCHNGDNCAPDGYQPFDVTLVPKMVKKFAPAGGRPTNLAFPYYNLQMSGRGLMLAIGWPGQWASSFSRDADRELRVTAGQELTHLTLKPGEEIRTPLMAILFWKGEDVIRAQNLWRRWMLAHNMPRPGGKPLRPMYPFCSGGFFEGLKVSEAGEKQFIDILTREGIRLDYWWMDAGWYPCDPVGWPKVGTWEVDAKRFPKGIRAVSDYAHSKGAKLVVWFEPERVHPDTWLAQNHPEWIYGGKGGGLLKLGDAKCRTWLIDHVDKLLTEQGIDLYRQDFNIEPLKSWRDADAPDRQGINENMHVQGYLAYWDELLRRHPGMLIDSCASGGRRNDLETLRRAVPLLRSDYQWGGVETAAGNQGHTYGLSSWVPFYGQGVYYHPQHFVYLVRSYMCPSFSIAVDVRKPGFDWDLYRRLVDQWRQVADCFLGDYYPLTPYSLEAAAWMAWQFDRPEQGDGMVQAFRHEKSGQETLNVKLRGLDPNAKYVLTDVDVSGTTERTGHELMDSGLTIALKSKPAAAIVSYRKKP
jgi:alpha-galactosidase